MDEKFFAWLDGELTTDEAAEIEMRVAADPELQALAEQHRALGARLRSAFDPIAAQPVALESFAPRSGASNVASFAEARVARSRPLTQRWWAQAASIGLVFAMGMAAGNLLFSGPNSTIESHDGQLVAAAALEGALNRQLASQPANSGPRIAMTFRDREGQICRTFTDHGASGVACMQGGNWRIGGLFQAPEGQESDYRMASGTDPRLAALVDSAIAGEPFDAAQEQQARDSGWK